MKLVGIQGEIYFKSSLSVAQDFIYSMNIDFSVDSHGITDK